MNKWAIGGAWVLVAVLATGLTWQIVSAADAQVGERPPLHISRNPYKPLRMVRRSGARSCAMRSWRTSRRRRPCGSMT